MKKILLFVAVAIATFTFGQSSSTFDVGAGYSQNGGLSFSFSSKKSGAFGWYWAVRGLNFEFDYSNGIDYSSVSNAVISEPIIEDRKDFGTSIGTLYNFKNSIFSIGGGLGYGIDYKIEKYNTKYDFQYIKDEYRYDHYVIDKHKITAEVLMDISLKKSLKRTFGFQVGYSTFHKAFGIFYYAF